MTDYLKPLPKFDPVTAPFWESLRRGKAEVQCCDDCKSFVFYPRALCPSCGSRNLVWTPVSGKGQIYSLTIVTPGRGPGAFKSDSPYVVALVELEEGCRMMSNIVDVAANPEDVKIGMSVEIVYDRVTEDITLPKFRPVTPVKPKGSRRGFAMAIMALGSIAISFAGVLVRSIEDADSWQINFYRALSHITAIMLILILQYRGKTLSRIRGVGRPGILGGLMLAGAGISYLQSITHTTVANTLFLLSAIPFFTALLAWLVVNERLRRKTLITMLVAAAGVAVILADGFGIGSAYGNLMGLLAALCFSGFAVIVRKYRDVEMMPTLVVSSVIILFVSLAARYNDLVISPKDVLLCFIWGAILAGFANWVFIIASRYLIAAEATLFMMLEFSLGPIWVWMFIGEIPTEMTVIGGIMVIGAVAWHSLLQLQTVKRGTVTVDPVPPVQVVKANGTTEANF